MGNTKYRYSQGEPPGTTRTFHIYKCPISTKLLVIVTALSLLAVLGLTIALIVVLTWDSCNCFNDIAAYPKCEMGMEVKPRDLDNPGVFDDLNYKEIVSVRDYLMRIQGLNLTPISESLPNNSYILTMGYHPPPKHDVLAHLDSNADKPSRTAIVHIIRGDLTPPVIQEYLVGDLPNPTWHQLFDNPSYSHNPIPYHARPSDKPEFAALMNILDDVTLKAHALLVDSYGSGFQYSCWEDYSCVYDFIHMMGCGQNSGDREMWLTGYWLLEGIYVLPIGLEILIISEGSDVSKWRASHVYYNGIMYDDIDQLLLEYEAGHVVIVNVTRPQDDEKLYSSMRRRGPLPGGPDTKPTRGPMLVEPDGHRYSVTGQHVDYFDWSFDFHTRTTTGLQLFDIRFRNERIAYEISQQEAIVIYTGAAPSSMQTYWYDSTLFTGGTQHELVKGVDCPNTATMIGTHHFFDSDEPIFTKNSVCVFEHNNGIPLERHYADDYAGSFEFYGGLVDYVLIVRAISDVWNYDYVFDYIFHANGVVEVKVAATGYLQTTFAYPNEGKYGYPISNTAIGSTHQHLFSYKVDLDIAGVDNRFGTIDLSVENVNYPWRSPTTKSQISKSFSLKTTEKEAAIQYNFDTPRQYIIYNENEQNKFGSNRAYRIHNGGMTKLLLPDDDKTSGIRWARYQESVTVRKDSEDMSSSLYNQHEPRRPIVDFGSYISDNENIVDKDLVLWVSMGTYHVPSVEELVTQTAGTSFTFFLKPFNYFDESPSLSSTNRVHISNKEDGSPTIETYGTKTGLDCQPVNPGPIKYDGQYKIN